MTAATAEPKVELDETKRRWLEQMGAALKIKTGGAGGQAADPAATAAAQSSAASPAPPAGQVKSTSSASASATAVPPAPVADKRVVKGGGGYVYEQHANGKIFIIESPKQGKKRIEVKDRKGYDAILAEIGPFPKVGGPTAAPAAQSAPTAGPSTASSLLDDLFGVVEDAIDKAAEFFGGDDEEPNAPGPQQPAPGTSAPTISPAATPEILGGAETDTEKKLAEFTQSMSNIIVDVNGEKVSVRPPYHVNRGDRQADALKNRDANPKVNALIQKVFAGQAGQGATTGKATPEQMQKFLQEAVDQKLATDTTAKGLRDFLDKYAISTDCSGLAVQALNFLADGDMVRGADEQLDAGNTGTGSLADTSKNSKFKSVASPSELQAGDMMVKGGSHVRLITDVDVQEDGIYFTTLESTAGAVSDAGDGVGERRWRFPDSTKFSGLEIQKGDKFSSASSSDRSYVYTRLK